MNPVDTILAELSRGVDPETAIALLRRLATDPDKQRRMVSMLKAHPPEAARLVLVRSLAFTGAPPALFYAVLRTDPSADVREEAAWSLMHVTEDGNVAELKTILAGTFDKQVCRVIEEVIEVVLDDLEAERAADDKHAEVNMKRRASDGAKRLSVKEGA